MFELFENKKNVRIKIFGNNHATEECYTTLKKLRALAKEEKLLLLDEGIWFTSQSIHSFHKPLGNGFVTMLTSSVTLWTNLYIEFNESIDHYVARRIDRSSQIMPGFFYMLNGYLENIPRIFSFLNDHHELKDNFITHLLIISSEEKEIINIEYEINKTMEKLKAFSFTKGTPKTQENVSLFKDIVSDIFSMKEKMIFIHRAFVITLANDLSEQYPEYKDYFLVMHDKAQQGETNSDYRERGLHLSNLFMARNIKTTFENYNLPITVFVGLDHTNDKKVCSSIQTILTEDFGYSSDSIEIIDINKPNFNLESALIGFILNKESEKIISHGT